MKKTYLSLIVIGFCILFSSCSIRMDSKGISSRNLGFGGKAAQRTEEYEILAGDKYKLDIENTNGNIELIPYDGDRIKIKAVKKINAFMEKKRLLKIFDEIKVEMTKSLENININVKYSENTGRIHNQEVILEVLVPQGMQSVNAETKSGAITFGDMRGLSHSEIKTVSGNVNLKDLEGESLKCTTISGNIYIEEIKGLVNCNASSGNIEISKANLLTGSEIYSTSGKINMDIDKLEDQGEYRLISPSGNIVIYLNKDLSFSLKAKTFSGKIKNEFKLEDSSISKNRKSKREIDGEIGEGRLSISVYSDSGNISIFKK